MFLIRTAALLSLLIAGSIVLQQTFQFDLDSGRKAETAQPRVVFDSNRSGTFGIYSIALDGSDLQVVADGPLHEMHPAVSPKGDLIAYAVAESTDRGAPSDVWLVEPDGSNARLFLKNAEYPSFRGDGNALYFGRNRQRVMVIQLDGKHEGEIFPNGAPPFAGRSIVLPRMSLDGRYLAFTSDVPHMWVTWIFDFKTAQPIQVGQGCEPAWSPDGKSLFWVSKGGAKSKSAIARYMIENGSKEIVQDAGEPFGHEYFPYAAEHQSLLLWSACPADQHSHYTANYQLFARNLAGGTRQRITEDSYTNRFPQLLMPNSSQ